MKGPVRFNQFVTLWIKEKDRDMSFYSIFCIIIINAGTQLFLGLDFQQTASMNSVKNSQRIMKVRGVPII